MIILLFTQTYLLREVESQMLPSQKQPRTVTTDVVYTYIDCKGNSVAEINGTFIYSTDDPYSMTATFNNGSQEVRWSFSRDLLIDGIHEPTGDGDVHVWPCLSTSGTAVTVIELCSPDGEMFVQVQSRVAMWFVIEMLQLVPAGTETDQVDIDAELAMILAHD